MKEINDIRDYRENKETQVWYLDIQYLYSKLYVANLLYGRPCRQLYNL